MLLSVLPQPPPPLLPPPPKRGHIPLFTENFSKAPFIEVNTAEVVRVDKLDEQYVIDSKIDADEYVLCYAESFDSYAARFFIKSPTVNMKRLLIHNSPYILTPPQQQQQPQSRHHRRISDAKTPRLEHIFKK